MSEARSLGLLLTLALIAAPAWSADFAPITDAERELQSVPGFPNAPAVVLFERGNLDFMQYPAEVSSILRIEVRIKILTEEGRDYAEVEVPHSRFLRLKEFKGRTILPDGREVPLSKDSIFQERSSRSRKIYLTKAAFPAVEVGAILDYHYTLRWDSIDYLEPWYFSNSVPTLLSEITYLVPGNMAVEPWSRRTSRQEMHHESRRHPKGREVRIWMKDLPPVPDEPYSFPVNDLSSRIMVVPKKIAVSGQQFSIMETWEDLYDVFYEDAYNRFVRKSGPAKKKAVELAAGATSTRAKIDAIHAFVRDEIDNLSSYSLYVSEDRNAAEVVNEGSGTDPEKALLLKTMLSAIKLKPAIVWASNRWEGVADLTLANPWWFDRTLVMVEVDGEKIYLDPSEDVASGRLPPYMEEAQALIIGKKPEVVTLPGGSFDDTTRRAHLKLKLDEEGAVRGEGSLILTGHHAWQRLRWGGDEEETQKRWETWLGNRFEGYEVSDIDIEESFDEQEVRVGWTLAQQEEDVLGDEASLAPSLPLGPVEQIFSLPAEQRLTPVQLRFADRDDVLLELSWPEGWEAQVLPQALDFENEAGQIETIVEHDAAGRKLTYKRRLDIRTHNYMGREAYSKIRDLYGSAAEHDAQQLVLWQP